MTNQEASKIIKDGLEDMSLDFTDEEQYEALTMAIKALEQEPSGDLISRQAVYEMLDSMLDDSSDNKRNQLVSLDSIADEIAELPSVKQEPSVEILKTEESNDNGTKYLNINVSDGKVKRNPDVVRLCSDVGVLEYVKPKTGEWQQDLDGTYLCSECGSGFKEQPTLMGNPMFLWCPLCGAKMVKPQESEG